MNDHIAMSPSGANSYLVPTADGDVVVNTGTRFELYAAPGRETLDGIVVWLPGERTMSRPKDSRAPVQEDRQVR